MGCAGSSSVKESADKDGLVGVSSSARGPKRLSVDTSSASSPTTSPAPNGVAAPSPTQNSEAKSSGPSSPTAAPLNEDDYRDKWWPGWVMRYAPETANGWFPRKISSYQKIEKIGQGTYSTVYKAMDLVHKRVVALKKVRADALDEDSITFLCREINILRSIDHPHILKLYDVATTSEKATIFLVLEYLEHDLAGLAALQSHPFDPPQVKHYMGQLMSALDHIHSKGIMHRDVKGSNLLLDAKGNLKLGDFGLAIQPLVVTQPLTTRVITLWYRPPELLLGAQHYDAAVDIWSAGCIFAELIHGQPIMPGRTEVEQLHQIFKLCGSEGLDQLEVKAKTPYAPLMPSSTSYPRKLLDEFFDFPYDALDVIDKMLSIIPANRGTAADVLASPYFTNQPEPAPLCLEGIPTSHEYTVKRLQQRRVSMVGNGGPNKNQGLNKARQARQVSMVVERNAMPPSGGSQAPTTKPVGVSQADVSKPSLNPNRGLGRRQSLFTEPTKPLAEEEPTQKPALPRMGTQRMNYNNSMGQGTFADESLFESKSWQKTVHMQGRVMGGDVQDSVGSLGPAAGVGRRGRNMKPRMSTSIIASSLPSPVQERIKQERVKDQAIREQQEVELNPDQSSTVTM